MVEDTVQILLLEDNMGDVRLIKESLRESGSVKFSVIHDVFLQTGLKSLARDLPDIILLDLGLPDSQGLDTLGKIINQAPNIPVIVLTGLNDTEIAIKALQAGAQDYLIKGEFNSDLLVRVILYAIERKNSEAALRESESRFRHLVENAPDGIFVQTNKHFVYVNPAAVAIFRANHSSELCGTPILDRFAQGFHEIVNNRISMLNNQKQTVPLIEEVCLQMDGTPFDVEVSAVPIHWEGSDGALVFFREITQRKLSEQVLKESEKRFRDISEHAQEWIWEIDPEGKYKYTSQAVEKILGYTPEEILQKHFYDLIHPDDSQTFRAAANVFSADNKSFQDFIVRNVHKNGKTVWLVSSGFPLIDDQGHLLGYRGVDNDITERKQQEDLVIKNSHEINLLYEAVKDLSQSLDLQSIYRSFYKLVSRSMKCDTLFIADFDRESELIYAKFAVTDENQVDVSGFPPILLEAEGQGMQRPVIRSGKSMIINNFAEVLNQIKTHYRIDEEGKIVEQGSPSEVARFTQSSLIVPILLNNQVTGVVQIQSCDKDAYNPENLRIAEALVSQIAVATNNAQLYQQSLNEIESRTRAETALRIRSHRQEKLAALGRELAATLDLEAIYRIAERHLKAMIDCPNFAITLFDPQNQILSAAYFVTDGEVIDPITLPPLHFNPQCSSSGRSEAIAEKAPVIVHDLAARRKVLGGMLIGSGQEPETAIYVPILVAGEVIGLLDLQSYQQNAYSTEDGEWLSVIANQIGLAIQNARQLAQTRQRVAELLILHNIDQAITSSEDSSKIYLNILEQIATQPFVDAVDILIFDPMEKLLTYTAGLGFFTSTIIKTRLPLGDGLAGKVALEKQPVHILNLTDEIPGFLNSPFWEEEKFMAYIGLPLLFHGELKGVLEIFSRKPPSAHLEGIEFLGSLAQQLAIAVENIQLFQGLEQANTELLQAYDATIAGWSQAMDLRDKETEGHTKRVTDLTLEIARALGLSEEKMVHLRRGALLHDIGKLGVPDYILLKPGPLTDEEWVIMKCHPRFAYEMLTSIDYLRPALAIPYCHHEKWDGTGYPRELVGQEIPLEARIFALVDVYDALTTDRPYRAAWSQEKTLAFIQEQSGKQFDPNITAIFSTLLRKIKPQGATTYVSTRRSV